MTEARLEDSGSGLTPVTEGWFVVNVRDAEWWFTERRGARCAFDNEYGDPPVEFAQLGINVTVLEPGETSLYHAEENQEAFLVLSGECALLVEDEERRLRPWDFFHSSAVDRARLRGRGRGSVCDPDGRFALGPGSELPGVGARGALRRERGGGDLRLAAGVREGRAVPARAAAELGSSALGVDRSGERTDPDRPALDGSDLQDRVRPRVPGEVGVHLVRALGRDDEQCRPEVGTSEGRPGRSRLVRQGRRRRSRARPNHLAPASAASDPSPGQGAQ